MQDRERETQRERKRSGRENRNVTLSLTAALRSYNTGPHWVRCQLFQTYPQQPTTVWILNGSSLLFSFYTWRPPVCLLSDSFCSIWLHGDPFVSLPHPVQKGHAGTKTRWECICSIHRSVKPPLLLMVLIRLLYVFTYTPLRMIMFPAHVARPEVCKQHSLS